MKNCTKCKLEKSPTEFSPDLRAKGGLRPWCKICCSTCALARYHADPKKHIDKARIWKQNNRALVNEISTRWRKTEKGAISEILSQAKKRAKQDGLPFLLMPADIQIPDLCPVFGTPLIQGTGKGPSPMSPSLDKIIPALGYVPGNVRIMSHKANVMKNDATPEQLLAFANWVQKTIEPESMS